MPSLCNAWDEILNFMVAKPTLCQLNFSSPVPCVGLRFSSHRAPAIVSLMVQETQQNRILLSLALCEPHALGLLLLPGTWALQGTQVSGR